MSTCCCCFELRKGIMIMGFTFTIISIIGLFQEVRNFSREPSLELMSKVSGGVTSIGVNILLFIGARNKRRYFYLPWMVISGMGMIGVLFIAGFLFFGANIIEGGESKNVTKNVVRISAAVLLLTVPISGYFWSRVFAHYKQLSEEETLVQTREELPLTAFASNHHLQQNC